MFGNNLTPLIVLRTSQRSVDETNLSSQIACGDKNDQPIELEWNRGRMFDKAVANYFLGLIKNELKAE